MNFAEIEINDNKFYTKTRGADLSNQILRVLHTKPPKNVIPYKELTI
jgi:hypothetical protein